MATYDVRYQVYEGEWLEGQRSGVGTLRLPNGDTFEGNWLLDKKEGPGLVPSEAMRRATQLAQTRVTSWGAKRQTFLRHIRRAMECFIFIESPDNLRRASSFSSFFSTWALHGEKVSPPPYIPTPLHVAT